MRRPHDKLDPSDDLSRSALVALAHDDDPSEDINLEDENDLLREHGLLDGDGWS